MKIIQALLKLVGLDKQFKSYKEEAIKMKKLQFFWIATFSKILREYELYVDYQFLVRISLETSNL
jgi:hypothetical protein